MITKIKDSRELKEALRYAIRDYKDIEGDPEVTCEIRISLDLGKLTIHIEGEDD